MGTRSITLVYENNEPFVNIYRQYDGYPSGHGRDLSKFMRDRKLINGFNPQHSPLFYSNGINCFAAGLIEHLKDHQIGGIYIYSVNNLDCGQDYEYHIFDNLVVVKDYNKNVIFCGDWNEFADYCDEDES